MRRTLKWGIILAVSIAVWTAIVHLLGFYTDRIQYADLVDRLAIVLPVVVLTLALLEEKRVRNGTLSVGRGVLTGVTVAAVSAPLTVAALWYYHHYVNPDWLSILVEYKRRELTSAGPRLEQIDEALTRLQQSGADRQQIVGGLIGTVALGLVLSLIIALSLKFLDRFRQGGATRA